MSLHVTYVYVHTLLLLSAVIRAALCCNRKPTKVQRERESLGLLSAQPYTDIYIVPLQDSADIMGKKGGNRAGVRGCNGLLYSTVFQDGLLTVLTNLQQM